MWSSTNMERAKTWQLLVGLQYKELTTFVEGDDYVQLLGDFGRFGFVFPLPEFEICLY